MDELYQAETVAIRACGACRGGLLESDRFCRWCGTHQSDISADRRPVPEAALYEGNNSTPLYTTSALQEVNAKPGLYHSVSGPLVRAVIAGIPVGASGQLYSHMLRKAVLALVSVPIWMIIVLLSPLDAYVAAKAISREI